MSKNDNNNAEKNNQPLIITSIIAAVVLILSLAWIFGRDDASTPEPATEQEQEEVIQPEPPTQNESDALIKEGRRIIAGFQASTRRLISAAEACDTAAFDAERPIIEGLAIRSQKLSAEIEKMESAPAELLALPEAIRQETLKGLGASQGILACRSGRLPDNWDQLTSREKNDLNPFDCDHETQWVSAENGTCINKPSTPRPSPTGADLLLGLGFDSCEVSADYLLENYLTELSGVSRPMTELREQADEIGLPAVLGARYVLI